MRSVVGGLAVTHRRQPIALRRRGFTLLELIVATILLAAMAATVVPLLALASRQQRETDRRQLALYEAQNILEQIAARPWSELKPGAVEQELPQVCREHLPHARLDVAIDPADDGGRRIAVKLLWKLRNGVDAAPMRLVTWRYPRPARDADYAVAAPVPAGAPLSSSPQPPESR
jgi:prepilin-type N-terminal cleavage/methylation domain-containing protein